MNYRTARQEIGSFCLKIVNASKFAFAGKTATSCRLLKFVLTLSRHEKRLGKAKRSCPIRGFPISLAGCGIQHFFAVIFGIRAQNWGGKRELKLRAGAGFRVFMGLGFGIRKGNIVGYGILIPLFACFWNLGVCTAIFFLHFAFKSSMTE